MSPTLERENDDITERVYPAEFVFPGHPDKLSDAIADALVQEASRREKRALIGVEVAVHRNKVFITGRIAQRLGVRILLAAVPALVCLGFIGLALAPTFAVLAAVMIVRRVGEYAFVRPGREMLFFELKAFLASLQVPPNSRQLIVVGLNLLPLPLGSGPKLCRL